MKTRLHVLLTLLTALMMQISFAQQRTVSGTVTDEGGFPIPGVNVIIKGTSTGTQTDFDGKFQIEAAPTDVLVFSYIGMQTREAIAVSATVNVTLADQATELEGLVVTAFGIKRNPKDLGYSVSTIKNTDVTENSEPDLIRSINGKVPGVNVNISTGVAGAANQITIRGTSSLTGNTQPLIIVDGVAYSNPEVTTSSQVTGGGGYENGLSSLDPNNIASINVLKGMAASALYGSRAMNGVIVITTKSGSPSTNISKKLSVNYSNGTYFDNIANLPDYQNKYGAGANFVYNGSSNGSWGPSFDSMETIPTWPNLLNAFPDKFGPTVPYVAKPNNVKDLFRTGVVMENSLNLGYSGEDGSFNLTLSDLDQNGYIPYNTYDRTSISTGGSFKLQNGLTIGGNLSYATTEQIGGFFGEVQFDGASSAFARSLFLARNWDFNLPYEDENGASVIPNSGYDHPLWSLKHDQIITRTRRTVSGINLAYTFNDNISASYRLGINRYDLDRKEIRDLHSRADTGIGSLKKDNYTDENIESTLLINFDYKLTDDIGLAAILGNNMYQLTNTRIAYFGKEFKVPNIFTMQNANQISSLGDDYYRKRNVGIFADVTFSYKEFLFLNGTARNDWASSLPLDNRSYFYPSASLSFILTEALKMDSKVLTFAKLRTSYAKTGRDADAEFLSRTFPLGNSFNTNPTMGNPTSFADLNLQPEFAKEFEIGADLEFFNRRIMLDFTYYNKDAYNLILPLTVSPTTGYLTYNTNGASMTNKGLEIGLTLVPIQTDNFKWTWTTNFTKNKNNVTSLKGLDRTQLDANNPAYVIPGQPFGVFYGTRFARDDQGNYLINEAGGGIIQDPELGIIGDPNPDFKMNFINTFTYKGLTLRAQVDWREGGDISSSTIEALLGRGVTKDTEDRERTFIIPGYYGDSNGQPILDGNGNKIPNTTELSMNELYFSPAGGNTFAINSVDEARIYDGTVYRLRELSLTYDLPSKWLEKTPFGRVSFGFVGNNLWYFAPNVPKYTNFDPEVTSYGSTNLQGIENSAAPTSKRYGFRLNLSF